MEADELDAIELSAADAARAVGVAQNTMLNWLDRGLVEGRQTVTFRRYVTVGALRRFLATRPNGMLSIAGLEEYVNSYVLPKREKGGGTNSTNVLALA